MGKHTTEDGGGHTREATPPEIQALRDAMARQFMGGHESEPITRVTAEIVMDFPGDVPTERALAAFLERVVEQLALDPAMPGEPEFADIRVERGRKT